MKYVSIDIETTGLDPETCEILEIGAIIDTGAPLDELPQFRFRIKKQTYSGEPHALAMHKDLFDLLAIVPRNTTAGPPPDSRLNRDWYGWAGEFRWKFAEWLHAWGVHPCNFVAAGKNFAHFDEPFLKKIIGTKVQWHHRILDPGSMFVRADDEWVPDTEECCKRAGIYPANIPGKAHSAIHDALVVIALLRKGFQRDQK